MSGQFLFYHENEAIRCDKCSDDERPCWTVPGWQRHCDETVHRNSARIVGQYAVTVAGGSCIDDVTTTHLLLFEIDSGGLGMNGYSFCWFKVTWRFKIQMENCIFQCWIWPEGKFTSVIQCFSSFMTERFCEAMDRLVSDFINYWSRATRTMAKMSLVPWRLAKRLTCNSISLKNWYCENINKLCYGTERNEQYWNLQAEVDFEATRFRFARDQCHYRKCAGNAPCSWY